MDAEVDGGHRAVALSCKRVVVHGAGSVASVHRCIQMGAEVDGGHRAVALSRSVWWCAGRVIGRWTAAEILRVRSG
jgi:hypothetical protein